MQLKRFPGIAGERLNRVVHIEHGGVDVVPAEVDHAGEVFDQEPEALLALARPRA
jgi:hypothetical protein